MKKILFLFAIPFIAFCGGNVNETDVQKLAYYDSLTTVLKNRPDSSYNTIDLSGEVEEVSVEDGKIVIKPPSVNDLTPLVLDIHIEMAGDSIKSYRLTAGRSSIVKHAPELVRAGDTRTKIAHRLGINVSQIKNTEPLKVVDVIRYEKN